MELLLLKFVAFLRPLAGIKYAEAFFELISVLLIVALGLALLVTGATRKALRFSAIDALIAAFTVWCLTSYVVYFESASIAEVAKLVIPLVSYTIAKNVISDERQYLTLLRWMIIGFAIPAIWSAALIMNGEGVQYVSYWTGVRRWEGVYLGSHNLGHSMTLLVIVLVLYIEFSLGLGDAKEKSLARSFSFVAFAALGTVALFCLYMSQVRTALIGFFVFVTVYLYFRSKKQLIVLIGGMAIVIASTVPVWLPALLPELAVRQDGMEVNTDDLGSGRPRFWRNDLEVFAELPLDQKLAGVGIGSRYSEQTGKVLYGHNDWLELLTQTGIVGVVLYGALQVLIGLAILRLPSAYRYTYLAVFIAVNVMMVFSNSYAWRIQVSQLYYLVLAFIDLDRRTANQDLRERKESRGRLSRLAS